MTDIVLLRPWWLLVLPVAATVAVWLWRRGPDTGGWEAVMPPPMLKAMRALGQLGAGRGRHRQIAALAAAVLMAVGLSGPALPRADAPALAGSGAVVIAVDMSPSVTAGPALSDAKAAAASVLTAAGGRPVGLIVYAGEAYQVAAPTADPSTLESQIAVLAADTMPDKGSRPAAALALARRMLEGDPDAVLVLVSDGGGVDGAFEAEAERLASDGIRLFALTLSGTAGGDPDPAALQSMADEWAPARSPDRLLAGLGGRGGLGPDAALAVLRFRDFGPLIAGLAMLPMLVLFRRRS